MQQSQISAHRPGASSFAGAATRRQWRGRGLRGSCARPATAAAAAAQRQAAPAPPDVLQVEQQHGLWTPQGVHFVAAEVRDYELDMFQVVNNAVYASYVQHGRHKAFASLGMSVAEFQESGTLMALSSLALEYKAPLRAGDVFLVTSAIAQLTAARLVIEHTVQRVTGPQQGGADQQPLVVCQGQATVVFLDPTYKPVRVPALVRERLGELAQQYKQSREQQQPAAAAAAQKSR